MPVNSIPRSVGVQGAGVTGAPNCAAMSSAAASACWAAMPPCLTEKLVPSPAAYTPSRPSTRLCRSTEMNPSASHGRTREPSKGDHLVCLERAGRLKIELAVVDPLRQGVHPQSDPTVCEDVVKPAAGGRTE